MDFDSKEELYYSWYLDELQDAGYINNYQAQHVFKLLPDVNHAYTKKMKRVEDKEIEYSIMKGHIYTTDFKIEWNESAKGIFYEDLTDPPENTPLTKAHYIANDGISYIEIKPKFDYKNMTRLVKINIKWVWSLHNEYVQIVVPEKMFKQTFTPERYMYTDKSNRMRVIKYKIIDLDGFLQHTKER